MKDFVFLLLMLVFFLSCNREKRTANLITGGEYKYWLVSKDANTNWNPERFYYFDKNGKWLVFTKYIDGSFEKYDGGDIILNETWNLINDSIINIGGKAYSIEVINEDKFIFSDKLNGRGRMLETVSIDLIPPDYHRMQ